MTEKGLIAAARRAKGQVAIGRDIFVPAGGYEGHRYSLLVAYFSVYDQVWHTDIPSGIPSRELAANRVLRERIASL